MPIRIQRKRTKGWKMPEGAVYVGRPTKWGNPFKVKPSFDAASAKREFETYVRSYLSSGIGYPIRELQGKDLVCWCPLGQPCHADVLLAIANQVPAPESGDVK